ncbi:MAG: ABC transporter ATP-binding protein [Planctomycetota bacterium]|jgi:iron complex transport system ATP-binding protein
MTTPPTKVTAQSVSLSYGPRQVLIDLSLAIEAGTMTLLAGRNGAGKSTLLNVLVGIRKPDRGDVVLDGTRIADYPDRERARKVTLIPQDSDSPFEFTGRELVMMGRYPHVQRFRGARPEDHSAVQRALEMTDAASFADRSVYTLSGGEMRRISIARALATEAEVVLADEPTSDLDLEHAVAILSLLHGLAEQGRTVLLASHDLNLTAPRCERVALLHDGRITHQGDPESVLSEAVVAAVFGVKSAAPTGYFPRHYEAL